MNDRVVKALPIPAAWWPEHPVRPAQIFADTSTDARLKFDPGHRANTMILAGTTDGISRGTEGLTQRPECPAPGRHLGKIDHLTVLDGRLATERIVSRWDICRLKRSLAPPIWTSNCESFWLLAAPSQSCSRQSRGHAKELHEQPTE
jgi:hypothetical protein